MDVEWDEPLPAAIAKVQAGERLYGLVDRIPNTRAWDGVYRDGTLYFIEVQIATSVPSGVRRAPVLKIVFDWYRVRRDGLNRLIGHLQMLATGSGGAEKRAVRALCRTLRYRAAEVRALRAFLRGEGPQEGLQGGPKVGPWHVPPHPGPGRISPHGNDEFGLMMAGLKPMAVMLPSELAPFVDEIGAGHLLSFREPPRGAWGPGDEIITRPEAADRIGPMLRALRSPGLIDGEDRRAVIGRLLGYSEADIAYFLARAEKTHRHYFGG